MTQGDEQDPTAAERISGDDPETGKRADRGSNPAERERTGEEQAAINRESDPPA